MNYPVHIVAVGGLIENEEGQILMIKSPDRGWEIPGGQVEAGETLTDALKREVKEETGIDIEVGDLRAVHSNITKRVQPDGVSPIGSIVSFGFTGRAVSGELTTSDESLEVTWVNREKILDLIDEDFMRDKVRYMLNNDGKVAYVVFSRNPYILHEVQYL
ncbi:NUDIX hydrolase [Clostridium omnivorum]|uniref:NUDIX hydrolase n=1 Tax=Clostridium omnivorum TaxID=1604902 RepID=A0ABQ5N4Q2_9CLOT|nr:NUDIX hydrolase [Clostridium sp. E14]GLC30184.1 NUDIX hydrolase [Clostridium sp. E14]